MRPASNVESFLRAPVGHWVRLGMSVAWAQSSERCGIACWGAPQVDTVRAYIHVMEHWDVMAPRFDVIQDASRLEAVDPEAFDVLFTWVQANRAGIAARVRSRIGVVPPGLSGFTLAGIGTVVDGLDPVRIVLDAREGYRLHCRDATEGDALHDEIAALIASLADVPPFLAQLRVLLQTRGGSLTLPEAARALSLSTRSFQRQLADSGTSFRDEVHEARFRAAAEILRTSDQKLAAVAARLGITEPALARLIREKTGQTPGELRAALRAG